MKAITILLCAVTTLFAATPVPAQPVDSSGTVVLLHGLARTSLSMRKMDRALQEAGFRTCRVAYPSTRYSVETLVNDHVLPAIQACTADDRQPPAFVTHSMGGILVRYMVHHGLLPRVGRVVMLSPPNQGSEVVDALGDAWYFRATHGPAGRQLGTSDESLPHLLGPAEFELGILTGRRSINLILSRLIPGTDDGKVSVEGAQLTGMADFMVLSTSHPFIMKNREAVEQTLHFLQHGVFRHEDDPPGNR